MPPGRRRFLDPDRKNQICLLVAAGFTLEEAAEHVGCSARTISRESARHRDFRNQLLHAAREVRTSPLKMIQRAAGDHWRAAAWLLERTEPERYAPRPRAVCDLDDLEYACLNVVESALEIIDDPLLHDRVKRRMTSEVNAMKRALIQCGKSESPARTAIGAPSNFAQLVHETLTVKRERNALQFVAGERSRIDAEPARIPSNQGLAGALPSTAARDVTEFTARPCQPEDRKSSENSQIGRQPNNARGEFCPPRDDDYRAIGATEFGANPDVSPRKA